MNMSITTKRGDEGLTDLMFSRRVSKTHPRVETNGAIDELNAALGMARVGSKLFVSEKIAQIQADLVTIMGELATEAEDMERYHEKGFGGTTAEMVSGLTEVVRQLEKDHGIDFKKWAVPGEAGSAVGAALDLARTIGRRAERHVAGLIEAEFIENLEILRYLNRVSDICWLLARFEERD